MIIYEEYAIGDNIKMIFLYSFSLGVKSIEMGKYNDMLKLTKEGNLDELVKLNVTLTDLRRKKYKLFQQGLEHVKIIEHFLDVGLTKKDIEENDIFIYEEVLGCEDVSVIKLLVDRGLLSRTFYKEKDTPGYFFFTIAIRGSNILPFVQYLFDELGMTIEDIRSNKRCLEDIIENDLYSAIPFFIEKGLNKQDLLSYCVLDLCPDLNAVKSIISTGITKDDYSDVDCLNTEEGKKVYEYLKSLGFNVTYNDEIREYERCMKVFADHGFNVVRSRGGCLIATCTPKSSSK